MSTDEKLYCPICDELIEDTQDVIEHDGKVYHDDCFFENFTQCDYCNEYHPIEEITWLDNYNQHVCDDCLSEHFYMCERCDEYIHEDDVYWGADEQPYCNDCFNEYFYRCDHCDEVLWRDDVWWDEDGDYGYCHDCYERLFGSEVIYSYHGFDDYVPRYLDDVDRNEHYNELYGIELEITGRRNTADELQDIMGNSVVLMKDSSVDGYEMITMPMSRQYFYSEFVPLLDKGLKYLRDNGMTGHNGGGIHIHFKKLQRGLEVANMVNILYGDSNDVDIWLAISQRRKSAMESWCSMTDLYNSPESIIEDRLLSPNGSGNHGTALNYDERTGTHELRIFNSNLRLERVIKNMECLFALEDYVKQHTELNEFNCTTRGYIDFVYHNKTKYPYIYNFMIEKNIFDKAYEYYNDIYVIEMGNETMTEV